METSSSELAEPLTCLNECQLPSPTMGLLDVPVRLLHPCGKLQSLVDFALPTPCCLTVQLCGALSRRVYVKTTFFPSILHLLFTEEVEIYSATRNKGSCVSPGFTFTLNEPECLHNDPLLISGDHIVVLF